LRRPLAQGRGNPHPFWALAVFQTCDLSAASTGADHADVQPLFRRNLPADERCRRRCGRRSQEVETLFRAQAEKFLRNMDVVTREEFEAIKEMAAKARDENDRLSARIAELEKKLGSASGA
jgi:BMFP domain-containing protein YqiC